MSVTVRRNRLRIRGFTGGCVPSCGNNGDAAERALPNSANGKVSADLMAQTAGSHHGPWRLSKSQALHFALPTAFFVSLGVPILTPQKA
jgi:hypothetical protein